MCPCFQSCQRHETRCSCVRESLFWINQSRCSTVQHESWCNRALSSTTENVCIGCGGNTIYQYRPDRGHCWTQAYSHRRHSGDLCQHECEKRSTRTDQHLATSANRRTSSGLLH